MKKLLCTVLLIGACLECVYAEAPQIICVGDSITYGDEKNGFPQELAKLVTGYVINEGRPSDTSWGIYSRALQLVKLKPKYLIIQAGYNDRFYAWMPTNHYHLTRDEEDGYLLYGFRPITIADYQDFIERIWNLCQRVGVKLILVTIATNPTHPYEPRLKFYNDILNAYPGTVDIKLTIKHFSDAVHLSPEGYKEYAKQIYNNMK